MQPHADEPQQVQRTRFDAVMPESLQIQPLPHDSRTVLPFRSERAIGAENPGVRYGDPVETQIQVHVVETGIDDFRRARVFQDADKEVEILPGRHLLIEQPGRNQCLAAREDLIADDIAEEQILQRTEPGRALANRMLPRSVTS